MIDKDLIRKSVRNILKAIGEDVNREGLRETPDRVAEAYEEIFSGYRSADEVKSFHEDFANGYIAEKGIEFFSMCEHHILPFWGSVDIIYKPGDKVLGLSKLVRIVDKYSRRLQIQERMTKQIGEELLRHGARGVVVIVRARHFCEMMRGVKRKPIAKTIWSGGDLGDLGMNFMNVKRGRLK